MGENSKIEWTHHTFNPWRGCEHATLPSGEQHPGCANCYAETMSGRNPAALGTWGGEDGGGKRVLGTPAYWRQPVVWNKAAEAAGERRRVFCASLADVFEDWQGPILNAKGHQLFIEPNSGEVYDREIHEGCDPLSMRLVRAHLFSLIDATPHLDWLLLTKRPENVRRMWPIPANGRDPSDELYLRRENVWLLTSVSDQETADALVPELLKCSDLSPVLGISAEPLLGPTELREGWTSFDTEICPACGDIECNCGSLGWVIVGGESGHGARDCWLSWVESLRDQCYVAGVPCFIKQLGARPRELKEPGENWANKSGPLLSYVDGVKDKKGGNWDEWPEYLRVREFPEATP